jgi:hypothetical protein
VLGTIYVATTGADTNAGTQFSPLKTFDKAASVAGSGQTILFGPGTYSGTDFTQPLPAGVTVDRNGTSGTVNFTATGSRSLVFGGSAVVSNIVITNFVNPIAATTGTLTLTNVRVVTSVGPVVITGNAQVTWNASDIQGNFSTADVPLIQIDTTASLTVNSGNLSGQSLDCSTSLGAAITARDSAKVTINNSSLNQSFANTIDFQSTSTLAITGTTFARACNEQFAFGTSTATIVLTNSVFTNRVVAGTSTKFTARGNQFNGNPGVVIFGLEPARTGPVTGTYDLGTPASPGGNFFNYLDSVQMYGIYISANSLTVKVSGNTWVASQQGADASGKYAVGTTVAAGNSVLAGRNYVLSGNDVLSF